MKRNGRSAHAKLAWAMAGAGLSILAPSAAALADQPVASLVDDEPVVVELFTSQGCNSCPPADALLGRLAERKDLLPLAFHVDYWNYLGWKDPFSSGLATDRQKSYSRVLDVMVYTPQMVIDGAKDAVGSDETAVSLAIDAEKVRPKLKLAVLRDGQGRYRIAIPADGAAAQASVYLALFDHSHQTPVGRGENSGRTLTEFNIVREWRKIGEWSGKPVEIALGVDSRSTSFDACAVVVQEGDEGPVRGAIAFGLRRAGGS